MKMLKMAAFLPVIAVTGCFSDSVMKAEARTIPECLGLIENSSGQSLRIIRDTPEIVSGKLSNGKTFACERKVSGTKGAYYEAWYTVD